MIDRIQEQPNSIQFTPVQGCNLRCDFCGIRGISSGTMKDMKYMTVEDATIIATQIASAGWNSRIEINLHGEPTLNPKIVDIVAVTRKHLPKNSILMITNGAGLLKKNAIRENINQLFNAGLNTIAIDCYKDEDIWVRIVKELDSSPSNIPYTYYPKDGATANPQLRVNYKVKRIVFIADIRDNNNGNHSTICNQGGAAGIINIDNPHNGKRCPRPFREIAIGVDLKISLCCNDWRGIYHIGDLHQQTLAELWQGERFNAARRKLILGQRDFVPCFGCEAFTYRNGLLPDKTGQKAHEVPPPDEDTERIMREAVSLGNTRTSFIQEWDIQVDGLHLPVVNPTAEFPPKVGVVR